MWYVHGVFFRCPDRGSILGVWHRGVGISRSMVQTALSEGVE